MTTSKKRKCLRCGEPFASTSAGNRICDKCSRRKTSPSTNVKDVQKKLKRKLRQRRVDAVQWRGRLFSETDTAKED